MFTADEKNHILHVKQSISLLVDKLNIPKTPYSFIAGGIFYSIFHGIKYKDIDVFVINGFQKSESPLTPDSIRQNNSDYITQLNSNISDVYIDDTLKVNTIFTRFDTRKDVISDFDYYHCCVSYDFNNLYISKEAFDAIMKKKLVVNNPKIVYDKRKNKFLKRGFTE